MTRSARLAADGALCLHVCTKVQMLNHDHLSTIRLNTSLRPSGVLSCWPVGLELTPGFYPGSNEQHRLFLGVYLKRTCSRVTSASGALGILNDCALYKSTHSLTRSSPVIAGDETTVHNCRSTANENVPIQLTQCRLPGLAISTANIYIYIFSNKYTEAILSNSARKLLRFEINKMLIAV